MCLDGTRISCVLTHGKTIIPLPIVINKRLLYRLAPFFFDPYLSTSLSDAMHLIPQAQSEAVGLHYPA